PDSSLGPVVRSRDRWSGSRELPGGGRAARVRRDRSAVRRAWDTATRQGWGGAPARARPRIIERGMSQLVHAAVAGDVREAEEMQEILRGAGIDSELESGEDDSVVVLVQESDLEAAQDAIEAGTEPDDLVAEP